MKGGESGKSQTRGGAFGSRIMSVRTNHEGEPCWDLTDEMELYTAVVTTFMTDRFYESSEAMVERIAALVPRVDPVFVAKLAVYARTEMNLRSVPIFLLVELSAHHSGDSLVSRALDRCILRADEIAETLACWQWRNKRRGVRDLSRVPAQLLTGIRRAFNRFDEYQFAKYSRDGHRVSLRDALFLSHPKPKDAEQQRIFDAIASDTLAVPYTWETALTELGTRRFDSEEGRRDALKALWEELVSSGRLGYMALLRNLRNIILSGVDDAHLEMVCGRLSNPGEVRKSRQLPFRFLSAYSELDTLRPFKYCYSPRFPALPVMPPFPKRGSACGKSLVIRDALVKAGLAPEIPAEEPERPQTGPDRDTYIATSEEDYRIARERYGRAKRTFNGRMRMYDEQEEVSSRLSNLCAAENERLDREYEEFRRTRVIKVLAALERAAEISASNMVPFDGRTLLACDASGSMSNFLSGNSRVELYDVGFMLSQMLASAGGDVTTGMFADTWKVIDLPDGGILDNVSRMRERLGEIGYCTNGYKVLQWACEARERFDTVVMFTDCQLWNSDGGYSADRMLPEWWHRYKSWFPEAKLYVVDLSGYGTSMFESHEKDVYTVAGWSEKIFDLIGANSSGEAALRKIDAISL